MQNRTTAPVHFAARIRPAIHAIISAVLLTFYGTAVCPFLQSLPGWKLALTLATALFIVLGLRPLLLQRWVAPAALEKRVRRQTQIDLGSYIAAGLGLTAFNHFVYRFPVESGLKLLIGIVTLGIFNALDLALDTERHMIKQAAAGGQRFAAHFRLESLTQNFAKGAVMVLALLGAIFFLVIKKDLRWLIGLSVNQLRAAERSVLIEVVFIIGVMMSLTIKLTVSYAKNLKIFFEHQTGVLNAVALGRLDTYVPIVGFNEFALIAQHTNTMIDSLREKARVESLFGKVVSPEIARRLLAGGEDGIKLGGTRRNLVILFSDLRNFTSFAEAQAPEAVMQFLNTYFTAMVTIIRQHGGLVDKFIGDGILAVFGLENPDEAASHAVQAAVSMVDACRQLATQLAIPVESGIGIHCGDVLAGNVGSQERLEFTFIGDVVNTASRVESATKQLQLPIVISEVVWKELAKESRALPWQDLGAHQLRGKAVPLTLFGLQPSGLSGS